MKNRLVLAWLLGIGTGILLVLAFLTFRAIQPLPEEQFEQSNIEITRTTKENSTIPATQTATVVEVIDGDTVVVSSGERVRLIGIDAPEKGENGFSESRSALSRIVEGKKVSLEGDVTNKDAYGRLLRYIWVDQILANYEMVFLGQARSVRYGPDTAYSDLFDQAQKEANLAGRGIWSSINLQKKSLQNGDCSSNLYNCSDFATRAEAQAIFDSCGGAGNDVHKLDSDGDGLACELLP